MLENFSSICNNAIKTYRGLPSQQQYLILGLGAVGVATLPRIIRETCSVTKKTWQWCQKNPVKAITIGTASAAACGWCYKNPETFNRLSETVTNFFKSSQTSDSKTQTQTSAISDAFNKLLTPAPISTTISDQMPSSTRNAYKESPLYSHYRNIGKQYTDKLEILTTASFPHIQEKSNAATTKNDFIAAATTLAKACKDQFIEGATGVGSFVAQTTKALEESTTEDLFNTAVTNLESFAQACKDQFIEGATSVGSFVAQATEALQTEFSRRISE